MEPHGDPLSLENLHDIVVPDPVSWWPPATGWWVLLAAVLVAVTLVALRIYRSRRANAYRRAALRELETVGSPAQLLALLKRVALVTYPREMIASLSGAAWLEFLEHEVPNCFGGRTGDLLLRVDYENVRPTTEEFAQLKFSARAWIEEHP
jgi:hypothetical protein